MKKLQWVDVDQVGGKAHWGNRERVVVGSKIDREITLKSGEKETVEQTVISITRYPNGAHAIETEHSIPESERPVNEG